MVTYVSKEQSEDNELPETPPIDTAGHLRTMQEQTIAPTLSVLGWVHSESISDISMEFHMTIRPKVTELTSKQASILLMVLVYQGVVHGIDIAAYLSMEFLRNRLVKSGQDITEVREDQIRKTVFVSEVILSWLRGSWLNLADREQLPDEVVRTIVDTGWLPSNRTYNSWQQYWVPQKFLEVRIVPVESLLDRTDSSTERYSGYTKGYGNDGSPASPQVEPYSAELDGVTGDRLPPDYNLLEMQMYQELLLSIEKSKVNKRESK